MHVCSSRLHTCIHLKLGNVKLFSLKLMQIGNLHPDWNCTCRFRGWLTEFNTEFLSRAEILRQTVLADQVGSMGEGTADGFCGH